MSSLASPQSGSFSSPQRYMCTSSSSSSSNAAESSPILKELYEKKQNLRRIASEVGSMATELRELRYRMAEKEAALEHESGKRQTAEAKVRSMEMELEQLQKNLEMRNSQAASSASVAEQYLRELVDARAKLGAVQAAAKESAESANAAHLQCTNLIKEIEWKNQALRNYENRVTVLGQQLHELCQDLKQREMSQTQLKDEVKRLEAGIKLSTAKAAASQDSDLRKVLEEVSARNVEQLSSLISIKDEEIARLREEIKATTTQLKFKSQELEAQLDKQRKVEQELKKKVIQLEFWLHEARSQTRKLQKISERKDNEIKALHAQLKLKELNSGSLKASPKLWDHSGVRILISFGAVILVFFAKH